MEELNSEFELVSVIIPNYNHEKYLKERIDSVLNQSYPNFEVIILDDCSTDDSRQIIERYSHSSKIKHVEYNIQNSGSTFSQWEKGINLAKGNWIWIAESDDVADSQFLNKLISASKEHNADIAYCCSLIIDFNSDADLLYGFGNMPNKESYPEFNVNFHQEGNKFIDNWMIKDNFIPNASAVIFNKTKISETDFRELNKMRLMGDWLFWIRLLKKGNIFYTSEILNKFRTHNSNVRNKTYNNRTIEFPAIFREFRRKSTQRKSLVDTFIFRYITSENFRFFTIKNHIFVFWICLLEGEFFKLFKSLIKNKT